MRLASSLLFAAASAVYPVPDLESNPIVPFSPVEEVTILNMMMKKVDEMMARLRTPVNTTRTISIRIGGPDLQRRSAQWPDVDPDKFVILEFDPTLLEASKRNETRLADAESVSFGFPTTNVALFPYAMSSKSVKNLPFYMSEGNTGKNTVDSCSGPLPPNDVLERLESSWHASAPQIRKNCWLHSRTKAYADNPTPWNHTLIKHNFSRPDSFFGEKCMNSTAYTHVERMPAISLDAFLTRLMLEFPNNPIGQIVLDVDQYASELIGSLTQATIKRVQNLAMICQRSDEWMPTWRGMNNTEVSLWMSKTKYPTDCVGMVNLLQLHGFKIATLAVADCITSHYLLSMTTEGGHAGNALRTIHH